MEERNYRTYMLPPYRPGALLTIATAGLFTVSLYGIIERHCGTFTGTTRTTTPSESTILQCPDPHNELNAAQVDPSPTFDPAQDQNTAVQLVLAVPETTCLSIDNLR